MSEDKNNSLIPFLSSHNDLRERNSASDIKRAIERFRHNSSNVPVDMLYTAYRSLKEMIDSFGPEFTSQSNHFNDLFLRILEERGESGSGIYRSVLRDSYEFRLLSAILDKDSAEEPAPEPEPPVVEEEVEIPVKLTLKNIVAGKKFSLSSYTEHEWEALVAEHFQSIPEEKAFVKSCGATINRMIKRGDWQDYHLVSIIDYFFRRLKGYDEVDISSKEYAMKLMNLLSNRNELWNKLHADYLEIIRK